MPDPPSLRAEPDGDRGDCPPLPDDVEIAGRGTCYSGRNCEGKVLNHRGAKGCKQSGGKSWLGANGQCYNL
jgi:hypothetical protein